MSLTRAVILLKSLLGAVLVVALMMPSAGSASLKSGGVLYKAGKFAEAFDQFMIAARAGNPVAQFLIGSM